MSAPMVVRIERAGAPPDVHEFVDPDGERSAKVVRDQRGSTSVTLSLAGGGKVGKMLIAVSDDRAFVGLDSPDGIFQYGREPSVTVGPESITIGGQATEIEARFIWSLEDAAAIVRSWIVDEDAPSGGWEQQ